MRRTSFVTLTAAFFASSALLCASAFAADAGTYRPGNAYHSITAGSPNVCEMQCSGDAQCRSWNYIRISANANGVCEFNDNISSPVPSAMSISGDNVSRARAASVVAGRTNTVRVGAPSVTQSFAPPSMPASSSMQSTHARASVNSKTYRSSPPSLAATQSQSQQLGSMQQQRLNSQTSGQSAAASAYYHRTPNARRAAQRPQFRHSLEDNPSPQMQNAQNRSAQTVPPQVRPQTRPQSPVAAQNYALADPRLQKRLQARNQSAQNAPPRPPVQTFPPADAQSAPQSYAAAPSGFSAPPGVPPLAASPTGSYMSPSMAGAPSPQPPRRVTIPQELSPRPMGSGDSLFGSLYDDVKIPRPIDPALATDPDAPIPTVTSVPSARFSRPPS